MLGFDAVGRLALGQLPRGSVTATLTAAAGSLTVTGSAVTFSIVEAAAAGSLALSGVTTSFAVKSAIGAGAFVSAGVAAVLTPTVNAASGTFTMNGQPVNEIIMEAEGPASFVVAGNYAALSRTGFDYDFQQGGIGHLLMEMERAKQLAAITRTIPPPVDRRSAPTFRPAPRPLAAPIAPAVDMMAAIQKQRMDEAAAASKAAKKRRDEEAILLLAS
jgi:hypothetical protein